MKKELKKKDKEPLSDWCKRLAEALHMTYEQREAMREVSIRSYITGVRDGEIATHDYLTNKEDK